MDALLFVILLVVAIFAVDAFQRWRRQTAWKRRRDDHDDDHFAPS